MGVVHWTGRAGVLLGSSLVVACTVINDIDVCERRLPPERVINVRTEGAQFANGRHAVAPLPAGGAFAAFVSTRSGASDETNTEIRGTLLDPEAQRLPTCGDAMEITYAAPPEDPSPPVQILTAPSYAPPLGEGQEGLLVWLHIYDDDEDPAVAEYQIFGRFLDSEACPFVRMEPFPISERVGDELLMPTVTTTQPGEYGSRFVVTWIRRARGFDSWLRSRVVEANATAPYFPRAIDPQTKEPTDQPVDLLPVGERLLGVAATPVGGDEFALTWTSVAAAASRVSGWVAIFDDRFQQVLPPRRYYRGAPIEALPSFGPPAVAHSDGQLMVALNDRDDRDLTRIVARFVHVDGTFEGDAFVLGSDTQQEQGWVSLMAQADRGFLAAWDSQLVENDGRGERSGRTLRVAAFDAERKQRFLNLVCDARDAQLNMSREGDQQWPSLARMSDGTPVAVWTDLGTNDATLRGRSLVRAVALPVRVLFPLR